MMNRRSKSWLPGVVCLCLAAGCGPQPPAPTGDSSPPAAVAPSTLPDPTPAPPGQSEEPADAAPAETAPAASPAAAAAEPVAAPPSESALEPAPVATVAGAAPASDDPVGLRILDWDQTLALVKQHEGKVVVMDIWSTYCPPCRAEFPGLVKLNNELGDKVSCISVSFDYEGFEDMPVESYREKVLAFLTKNNATLTNILCSTAPEEIFLKKIKHASLPVVYVFNQQGELAGQFPDPKDPSEFTYAEHVRPLVEKLASAP